MNKDLVKIVDEVDKLVSFMIKCKSADYAEGLSSFDKKEIEGAVIDLLVFVLGISEAEDGSCI